MSARMVSWMFPSRLRGRLVLLVLLGVFPALVLIIQNVLEMRRMGLTTAREEVLRLVRLAAVEHDRLLENGRQLLVTLGHLRQVRMLDARACEELLEELLKAHRVYANIALATVEGEILATAVPVTNLVNLAGLKVFQDVTNTMGFAIGEYQVDPLTRRATVFLGYPVQGPVGRLRGVILLALDLDWLYRLHAMAQLPEGSSFTVSDRNRVTLARFPDPERKFVGQTVMPVRPSGRWTFENEEGRSAHRDLTQERTAIGMGRDAVMRLYGLKDLGTQMGDNAVRVTIGIPIAHAHAVADRLLWRNLGLLALATVLAVVAAWYGGSIFVVSKIKKLVDATQRMQGGDMGVRVGDLADPGEVGDLAAAFDRMAEALQRQFVEREQAQEALRALNRELELRVGERTGELRRSNEDLEQFAYAASHDLQEPLRMVTSYLGLLEQRYSEKLDQDARDFIGYAVDGARRMHRLINDLLAYSRVQTRAKAVERVDCRRIVEQVLDNLKVALEESRSGAAP